MGVVAPVVVVMVVKRRRLSNLLSGSPDNAPSNAVLWQFSSSSKKV